ncbi:glycoside hydrolase family 16 protein [Pendulispora brunnea]|uniref:Glycoside hydrolase family 16 protein n=1 Tax=Pendulispora brunnea TaxID=2905690 RepID=A0ABZ2K2Q7_9BACT
MAPSSRTRKLVGLSLLLGSMNACYWITSTDGLTGGDGGNPSRDGGPGSDANDDTVVYPPGSGWKLTFHDEFNGNALGQGWTTEYDREGERAHSDPGNGELQWYQRENVQVSGGSLKLIAKREDHQASRLFNYTSGMVQSKSILSFQYGYIEAKIKLPKGNGLHPSFWSWPMSESSTPELDIASFGGGRPNNVTAILRLSNSQQATKDVLSDTGDWSGAWHTFAIDSEPNGVTWYFDGKPVHNTSFTVNAELYLLFTLAVNDQPAASSLQATYEIDYVRVFTK